MTIATELRTLADCEKIIERGLAVFTEVGAALVTIRDERLYKETHCSFQEYCEERWQMSRVHADRMISAAAVAENLKPIGFNPSSESQIRPLTKLAAGMRVEVWKVATATKPNPTAKEVQSALEHVTKTPPKEPNARPAATTATIIDPILQIWLNQTRMKAERFLLQHDGNEILARAFKQIIEATKTISELTA